MATPRAQIRVHRYVSGWCEAALHYRCKGSYAGTACCCSCHRQAVPGTGTAELRLRPADPGNSARPGA
ncbi:MAG: hypothetical protein ACLPQY_24080 [Streptosporangiaceae bacterium]